MLKKLIPLIVAIVLFAAPLVGRWLYYYDGQYEPGDVPRPDLSGIEEPAPEIEPFADEYTALAPGTVVVDLSHANRILMTELNVLQARLSARGQKLESIDTFDDLKQRLRRAKALIVVSPGQDWTDKEVEVVREFVDKGGRLLLVADPTRFVVEFDSAGNLSFDYDAPHMNTLASGFGVIFQSDYLYNTVENEGNFRNIRLTDFGTDTLTSGLDQIIFYAAHSIETQEPVLIAAGGETRSSTSQRTGPLPVGVLAADERVLALGDLTFLTEPHNAAYDNDRFIANIADFVSGAARTYELADFPHFFDDEVDLVYSGDPLLDSDFLSSLGDLQDLFGKAGKTLIVREEEDGTRDTLLLGLYEEAEEAEPYLAAAQVTLLITPTQEIEPEPESEEPEPTPTPTPAATETVTGTPAVTPTVEITLTPEVEPEPEITATVEASPTHKNRVAIESLGDLVLTGTSLILFQTEAERDVVVLLANTKVGLSSAVERLATGDLEDCLIRETVAPTPTLLALCPTGEVLPGEGAGGWPETGPEPPAAVPTPEPPPTDTDTVTETVPPPPTPEPVGEPEGSVLIVALDEGEGRYDSLTSLDDYAAILEGRFDVVPWSVAENGPPEGTDVLQHDLVILTFGDYDAEQALETVSDAFFSIIVGEIPFVMSGAYVGDTDNEVVMGDVEVSGAEHPVAAGFGAGEVVEFVTPPSGSEYEMAVLGDVEAEENVVVFVRGPDSEEAGAPAVVVAEDPASNLRIGLIGFPVYLLPEEAKGQLVLNMVDWLLGE